MEIGAKRRLERKARPRSGSPRFIVRFTALPSNIVTIGDNGVCIISSIAGIVRSVMVADTTTAISIGAVTVSR